MLSRLYIENLVVIKRAEIDFLRGFNVFTGETGAGKSILINGINAILGQRVSKDIVRAGEQKALISACFDDIPEAAKNVMSELGIECEDELIMEREITADGKSKARINSRPVSATALRDIGEKLVNIHGQHGNQILLDRAKHLEIIDSFGGLDEEVGEYKASFKELQDCSRKIKELSQKKLDRDIRINFLTDVIDEINSLKIESETEDEEVEREFDLANNAVSILNSLRLCDNLISGTDSEDGILARLSTVQSELESSAEIFSDLEQPSKRIASAAIEIEDIAGELSKLSTHLDIDPSRFAYLSARRDELIKIKKKYGPTLKDVLTKLEEYGDELLELSSVFGDIESLTKKRDELLLDVSKRAKQLSKKRQAAALDFEKSVGGELKFLNMENVEIKVAFESGKLTSTGLEHAEIMISANPGEEPKSIAKIASGGELSRIMLALKCVTAHKDDAQVMIFDEIDTGVSGKAAQKIGQKLFDLSSGRQVICVTHLSQIAAFADRHFLIEKNISADAASTSVIPLDFEARKAEIARIMSGEAISDVTLQSAEELIISSRAKVI